MLAHLDLAAIRGCTDTTVISKMPIEILLAKKFFVQLFIRDRDFHRHCSKAVFMRHRLVNGSCKCNWRNAPKGCFTVFLLVT